MYQAIFTVIVMCVCWWLPVDVLLWLAALALYLPLGTWLFYLACMHVDRQRHVMTLSPVAMFVAKWVLLPIGQLHNILNNLLPMTLIFGFDPPKEWVTTERMNRYRATTYPNGWRKTLALTICAVLLNPFDRRGIHT